MPTAKALIRLRGHAVLPDLQLSADVSNTICRWAQFIWCPLVNLHIRTRSCRPLKHMSRNVRKHNFEHVWPQKMQINLHIRIVWSIITESVMDRQGCNFLHANNKESDQTVKMRRLIWVFVRRTCRNIRVYTLRLVLFQYTVQAYILDHISSCSLQYLCVLSWD